MVLVITKAVGGGEDPLIRDKGPPAGGLALGLQGDRGPSRTVCGCPISGLQDPTSPSTLIVTCQGVLSWLDALTDMFPTPQMTSARLETSVMSRGRRSKRGVMSRGPGPPLAAQPAGRSLTQHVLKGLVQILCSLQSERVFLSVLLGPQLIQFFPVHLTFAHPNGIDV